MHIGIPKVITEKKKWRSIAKKPIEELNARKYLINWDEGSKDQIEK